MVNVKQKVLKVFFMSLQYQAKGMLRQLSGWYFSQVHLHKDLFTIVLLILRTHGINSNYTIGVTMSIGDGYY